MKVIDAHVHAWDLSRQQVAWVAPNSRLYGLSFGLDDLRREYSTLAVGLAGAVYVEIDSDDPIREDEIVYEEIAPDPLVVATVMRARLSPSMRVPLAAVGIREPLHIPSQPAGRCLQKGFVEGLKLLGEHELTFDACVRADELTDLACSLEQVPQTRVVVDHLGNVDELGPGTRDVLRRLADCENVWFKVSGFDTSRTKFVAELLEFVRDTVEPSRLMYASNYPVVKEYSSLREHWDVVTKYCGDVPGFFAENAMEAYNIDDLDELGGK